jgi:hypothetical protein
MMPFTRSAILDSLRYYTRGPLLLRLYANDIQPHRNQILSDFLEADFPGYAAVQLDDALWVDSGADPIMLRYPKQTFRLAEDIDAAAYVYGHYITRGYEVIFAEKAKQHKLSIAYSRIEITPIIKEA